MLNSKNDVLYTNFGKRLLELRIASGYTQEDIVKLIKANTSLRSYQEYENGHSLPSAETLIHLSKFYNVSIDYLLFNSCENKPRRTWGDKLLSLCDLISDHIIIPVEYDESKQFLGKPITGVFVSIDKEIQNFLKQYRFLFTNSADNYIYVNSPVLMKLAEEELENTLRRNREIFPFSGEEIANAMKHVDLINKNIEKKDKTKKKRAKF